MNRKWPGGQFIPTRLSMDTVSGTCEEKKEEGLSSGERRKKSKQETMRARDVGRVGLIGMTRLNLKSTLRSIRGGRHPTSIGFLDL